MIPGIATQGPFSFLRRNVAASPLDVFNDDDVFDSAVILSNVDRALRPNVVADLDTISACASSRVWLLTPLCVVASDSTFAAKIAARSQILSPALHVAADVFKLPAVAIPGILQTSLHRVDDVIFAPFVAVHGSLRPALFTAFDAIYAPAVAGARTLLPTSVYNATDSFFAPVARVTVRPSRVIDNDTIFAPTRT